MEVMTTLMTTKTTKLLTVTVTTTSPIIDDDINNGITMCCDLKQMTWMFLLKIKKKGKILSKMGKLIEKYVLNRLA